VGFGLQNIFNNFVSGLILLFERPVQVGDVIQMDDIAGTVDRIGIRASVVRANNGSEIIVPNGKLISERLINWTFSSRRRGIELDVAVAHGADPKRVIELMNAAAVAHPRVEKSPPPQTLLMRMGPDWLGFELRAFTERIEDWVNIRSDLSIAINDALAAEHIALK
jgi:small-conductance mechanosensitive channel